MIESTLRINHNENENHYFSPRGYLKIFNSKWHGRRKSTSVDEDYINDDSITNKIHVSNVISIFIEIKTNEVVNINKCHKTWLIRRKFILQGEGF